ncbi:MAG: response regulator [Candidatus Uhrbacteria bacterium]
MAKKLIYVAEDDLAYSRVYKSKLESEGFDVVIIVEGEKVIPALKKKRPDLLVLDLIMPGKNGFEILQEIRASQKLKNLKVIIASNLSQESDQDRAKKFGITDFFVKADVSVMEMVAKIKNSLKA